MFNLLICNYILDPSLILLTSTSLQCILARNMAIKSKITAKTLKELEELTGVKLTIGKLIWVIRDADGISQIEFAKKLDISKQHLCDIEHNRKIISPQLAAKYAQILGYSKEQFIRLALQDLVDRDRLHVQIDVIADSNPPLFRV